MLPRPAVLARIRSAIRVHPVVGLLGPRQCGKTTLARQIAAAEPSTYFDLEDPRDIGALSAPMTILEGLSGLVIIDEVQRKPELMALVRVLVDRADNDARFLLLGSASPHLMKGASESLAGRIGFVDLSGFDLDEVGTDQLATLWLRGGYPRAFLADDDVASMAWRSAFVRTFLERDIPQLGITVPAETLRRFWTMIAHFHGRVWNAAELARSLGSGEGAVRRYLDILAGAYMVRVLPPWFENIAKRQVRSPKVYLRDSGLLHTLLQLTTAADVHAHPKLGASWEGFALEQVVGLLDTRDAYFWASHSGAELDLLVMAHGRRYGFEFKFADAPHATRAMHIARDDLGLAHLWVVYPGARAYGLGDRLSAVPAAAIGELVKGLGRAGAGAEAGRVDDRPPSP